MILIDCKMKKRGVWYPLCKKHCNEICLNGDTSWYFPECTLYFRYKAKGKPLFKCPLCKKWGYKFIDSQIEHTILICCKCEGMFQGLFPWDKKTIGLDRYVGDHNE